MPPPSPPSPPSPLPAPPPCPAPPVPALLSEIVELVTAPEPPRKSPPPLPAGGDGETHIRRAPRVASEVVGDGRVRHVIGSVDPETAALAARTARVLAIREGTVAGLVKLDEAGIKGSTEGEDAAPRATAASRRDGVVREPPGTGTVGDDRSVCEFQRAGGEDPATVASLPLLVRPLEMAEFPPRPCSIGGENATREGQVSLRADAAAVLAGQRVGGGRAVVTGGRHPPGDGEILQAETGGRPDNIEGPVAESGSVDHGIGSEDPADGYGLLGSKNV